MVNVITAAEVLNGHVVGDTITVLAENIQQHKLRLVEVDAPESKQPYGAQSKQILSDIVFNKVVRVEVARR